jgi:hypothetical protein
MEHFQWKSSSEIEEYVKSHKAEIGDEGVAVPAPFDLVRIDASYAMVRHFGPVIEKLYEPSISEDERKKVLSPENLKTLVDKIWQEPGMDGDYWNGFLDGLIKGAKKQYGYLPSPLADFVEAYAQIPSIEDKFQGASKTWSTEEVKRGRKIDRDRREFAARLSEFGGGGIAYTPNRQGFITFLQSALAPMERFEFEEGDVVTAISAFERLLGQNLPDETIENIISFLNRMKFQPPFFQFRRKIEELELERTTQRVLQALERGRESRSEARSVIARRPEADKTISEPPGFVKAVAEINYAQSQGFVKTELIGKDHVPEFIGKGVWPYAPTSKDNFQGLRIISNPVMLPNDNLFLHLDTEELLYSWTPYQRKVDLKMTETHFNINGTPVLLLREETPTGYRLLIRESVWNSVRNARRGVWPYAPTTAIQESVRLFQEEARKLIPNPGLITQQKESKVLLLTQKVIQRNYGISRSLYALASLGYQVFVYEDDSRGVWPYAPTSDAFYQTYGLNHLIESGLLTPVQGSQAEVLQALTRKTGKQVLWKDVTTLSFEEESISLKEKDLLQDSHNLLLKEGVLGLDARHRADYPVLFLAARLRDQPEDIARLGTHIIETQSLPRQGPTWVLHETPASDLTGALTTELTNYLSLQEEIQTAA